MNDTCATHRSRVPRRSFGRNKRRSDDIGRRERTRPGFYFMFCVRQSSARGCRFSVMFVYFIIKVVECSPVPASFFPYLLSALQRSFSIISYSFISHKWRGLKAVSNQSQFKMCISHIHNFIVDILPAVKRKSGPLHE